MRKISIILGFIIASHFAVGKDLPKGKDGKGFESVFQKLISGESKGTVNGLLILQNVNKEETIVDFQSGESKLILIHLLEINHIFIIHKLMSFS